MQTELTRLKPATIYVAGGTGAVSDTVLKQLRALNGGTQKVLRGSGIDRYQTAIAIAKTAFPSGTPKAYLAYGLDFPDALSAGAAAGANDVPVLLVKGSVPDATTLAGLNALGVTSVKIAGGTGVIPGTYPGGLSKAGMPFSSVYLPPNPQNSVIHWHAACMFFPPGRLYPYCCPVCSLRPLL